MSKGLTEAEVIEKLTQFKDKLIKFRDERNQAQLELADSKREIESLQSVISDLDEQVDNLKTDKENALTEVESIHKSIDNIQELYSLKEAAFNDLKEKTYHTIKHLVENVIEPRDEKISSLESELSDAKERIQNKEYEAEAHCTDIEVLEEKCQRLEKEALRAQELDNKVVDLERQLNDPEKYIKVEDHKEEIKRILDEKDASDKEKDTVLSKTWKNQVEVSQQLTEKTQENAFLRQELEGAKADIESLKTALDDKDKALDTYKESSSLKLKELEESNKKVNEETKLTISRLTEKVQELTRVKDELTNNNNELLSKVSRLEEALANKTEKPSSTEVKNERNIVSKDTIPYKFGSTTPTIMQKAKDFIGSLYEHATEENGVFILGKPEEASKSVGLSQKEFDVFMNRLSECLEFDGVPLLYNQNGIWKSNLTKIKLIDYISSISN